MSNTILNDVTNYSNKKNIFPNVTNEKIGIATLTSKSYESANKGFISETNLASNDKDSVRVEVKCALNTLEGSNADSGRDVDSLHPNALLPISMLANPKYFTSYINKYVKPKSAQSKVNPVIVKTAKTILNKSKANKQSESKPKRNVMSKRENCQKEINNMSKVIKNKVSEKNAVKCDLKDIKQNVIKKTGTKQRVMLTCKTVPTDVTHSKGEAVVLQN
ncbi:uncharacterized protein LOC119683781 [Teleopsis dalmanni]|uniref:uncharacterized protein LOC119683781 n=1 Tax=Teleopsis dalmanni TaxID=139649 RepID=UPI0018CE901D|nr:uncharacterized protein LOC119683781 [Teleopsis dalmanni]